ncbi:HAMP domain-containing sensor histidine kinase [Marmoricola sp. URHB0036]|uniref:sensor histidine kinase n=1 Tax=Marmoricola sp. URHB0036 TaxID=1298863 RepID=UPI0004225FC5|nr:ATP-binding protein [Marmoricola sp. URHB0036]
MKRRLSLRARATVLGTLAIAALLAVGALLLVSTLEGRLTDASDHLSRSRVDDLRALARTGDLPSTLRNVDDNGVAQVVGPGGRVLAASPNITGKPPVAELQAGQQLRTSTFRAADDQEIESYRFWYAAGPSPEGTVTVYVGDSLEAVSEASAALRRALWFGVPVVVILLGLVIWYLLGRTIGRLDRIRAEVDRISEQNLHTRVAGDGVEDEVGRLAATMNALLERLDVAVRRQRDFVADVSHDLQSPLAAQRVALEVALSRPRNIDTDLLRAEVLGATADMERLVGELLVVASIDADVSPEPAAIDLDSLVLEEAARARTRGLVHVDTTGVSAAPAHANADDVRRVVRNLLDNAVVHARTRVQLTVECSGGWAALVVLDDGPGVPIEQRDRIFDRFYRAQSSRARDGGNGLGLSIARGLAERNRGRLDLVDAEGGATMRLLLPTDAACAARPDISR